MKHRTLLVLMVGLVLAGCSITPTNTVNDELPSQPVNTTPSPPPSNPSPPPANPQPTPSIQTLAQGTFYTVAPNHDTSGTASILKLTDGSLTLRLENFKTVIGPDVRVWLSSAAKPKDSGSVGSSTYLDLGNIKSTNGNQNYAIPAGTNLETYKSVVIWCKTFSVNFGSAALEKL